MLIPGAQADGAFQMRDCLVGIARELGGSAEAVMGPSETGIEAAISQRLFAEILRLIDGLRPKPAPT